MARPWYTSGWFRLAGGILALLLVVVLLIPLLVPVDRFRPLLTRLIEEQTGRRVEIAALRLHLFPTVRVRASDVRMKNPAGFPQGDTLAVASIDIGVTPRALLSRRLVVTAITITGVRVNLLRDSTGKTNYDLSGPPGSASARPAAPESEGAPFLSLDRVGSVTVKNVVVTVGDYDLRRKQTTTSLIVSGLNARVQSIHPSTSAWIRQLESITELKGVRFSTPSLTRPILVNSGTFTIKGGVGRGTFTASLDEVRAEGEVTVAGLNPPSITFAVTIPRLDLGKLDALFARSSNSGPDVQGPPGERRLWARGSVNVNAIAIAPITADRLHGQLSVYTNTIELDSYAFSLYGGTVQGKAALAYAASRMPAVVTTKVRGVDLGRVVKAAAPQARRITGTLDADLRLATALGGDPMAALTGGGTFTVRNGAFQGLDLQSNLAMLVKVLEFNVPAGDTRFRYFGGDLRIARQRGYSESLRLDAEGMEGTARGSFGFNKTLDYAGTGVLKRGAASTQTQSGGVAPPVGQILENLVPGSRSATGVRVPFSLRGTFDDPKFALAGTPQLIQGQNPGRGQQQPQPQPPQLNLFDLFKPK